MEVELLHEDFSVEAIKKLVTIQLSLDGGKEEILFIEKANDEVLSDVCICFQL